MIVYHKENSIFRTQNRKRKKELAECQEITRRFFGTIKLNGTLCKKAMTLHLSHSSYGKERSKLWSWNYRFCFTFWKHYSSILHLVKQRWPRIYKLQVNKSKVLHQKWCISTSLWLEEKWIMYEVILAIGSYGWFRSEEWRI